MKKFLLLMTLFQMGANHSTSQELKLNLKTGETYYHNNLTTIVMSQEINGELLTSDISYGGRSSYTVKEKKDSIYNLEVKFESLYLSAITGDVEISADTEKVDSTNAFNLIMKEITERPFKVSLTEHGIVMDVNMDGIFDNLFNFNPDIPKLQKAQMIYLLKQSFGEEAMKGATEMITAIYPKGTVDIGDAWKSKVKLKTVTTINMNNRFELINRDQDQSIIKVYSETVSDKEESFSKINGELLRFSSKGSMESTYKIDSKTGWIIESEIVQEFTGLIEKKWREDSKIIIKIPYTHDGLIKIDSN